jgi:phosphatidylserine/phosphatidylglycerophosphate/cardiolipin synthase-like enzyme
MRFVPVIILITFVSSIASGQIAAWNLSSATTSATISDANLTASSITVVPSGTISYQSSPGDIYCGSWPTSTAFSTAGKCWQFSVTAAQGFEIAISSLTFRAGRTSTGPQLIQVQYSLDGFMTPGIVALGETPNSNTTSLTEFALSSLPPPSRATITFRIWGYGASGSGNFRLNNIILNGSISPVAKNNAGMGTACVLPAVLNAGHTADVTIQLVGSETDTISKILVVVPAVFRWQMEVSDISLIGNSVLSATTLVNENTISIMDAKVTKLDTAQIVIHSVTAPDSSATAKFLIKTAADDAEPAEIQAQPLVYVMKVSRIAELHMNDSLGIPAPPDTIGAAVAVSGIITACFVGSSYVNLFVQDKTGGIGVFVNSLSSPFQVGDSATIAGVVAQFRGLTEIYADSTKWIIHSHGNKLPDPLVLTCADVNQTFNDKLSEPNESRLVRINNVTYDASSGTIKDITGTTRAYIPLITFTVPSGTFDIVGILKQYYPGYPVPSPPYTGNYEIDPRTQDDIIVHFGLSFTMVPNENDIKSNSVTIDFKTSDFSTAIVRYGVTQSYQDSVVVDVFDTVHSVMLNKLSPATVYHYQVSAIGATGTNTTGDAMFSTASPAGTTGAINVYFNHRIDPSVAMGDTAKVVDIASKFIERIDSAKFSIDLALYSLSGNVGRVIVDHLLSAKNRGVRIRMIMEDNNLNASLMDMVRKNIPLITNALDQSNVATAKDLMHNKFAVFDFRDTNGVAPSNIWVWTGSWNPTDAGDNDDAQNSIEIQDKALAQAYTIEFEEMWGSSSDVPDSSRSRFGSHKTDNTPHKFNINNIPVELYFSPSDQTTLHVYKTLASASSSINVCMFAFTRADLAQELVEKMTTGSKVRVVMDDDNGSGNQFSFLRSSGVDVHLKGSSINGYLHHKYAIIDAENLGLNAAVITGSHNWSTSAESSNDENELIFHDKRIANFYLQEFKARYIEAGGTDNITPIAKSSYDGTPRSFGLDQNFPNPFNPSTIIGYRLASPSHVTLKIYDVLGREVETLVDKSQNEGYYTVRFDASQFASGVYFCRLVAYHSGGKRFVFAKKMLLVK